MCDKKNKSTAESNQNIRIVLKSQGLEVEKVLKTELKMNLVRQLKLKFSDEDDILVFGWIETE